MSEMGTFVGLNPGGQHLKGQILTSGKEVSSVTIVH